jgi:hypothetical protein
MKCPECGKEMPEDAKKCDCGWKKKAEHADGVGVARFDESFDWMTRALELTAEGFLTGRAIVTNIGVFTYRTADGKTHAELRLPEEVFDGQSLNTLKMKPITNDHPIELVTPENITPLQVGMTGSAVSSTTQQRDYDGWTEQNKLTDGFHLAVDVSITEKQAIAAVQAGKTALSCGYTCDLEPKAGVWCGVPYDYIQRNIRYNHVAIVDAARAGDAARLRLDSAGAVMVADNKGAGMASSSKRQEANQMADNLKKITLDGVERQAEDAVVVELHKTKERADQADAQLTSVKAELSQTSAKLDAANEQVTKLTADLEAAKAEKLDQAKFDAAVNAKVQLIAIAAKAGVEKLDGTNEELMKAIILKASPDAKLDGKDANYIQARFDMAVEQLEKIQNADGATRSATTTLPGTGSTGSQETAKADSAAARERYLERLRNPNKE